MPSDAVIQVRVDAKTKDKAAKLFNRLGLSTSDAVRLFINQALKEKGMPFRPHVPNRRTAKVIRDAGKGDLKPATLDGLAKQWDDA